MMPLHRWLLLIGLCVGCGFARISWQQHMLTRGYELGERLERLESAHVRRASNGRELVGGDQNDRALDRLDQIAELLLLPGSGLLVPVDWSGWADGCWSGREAESRKAVALRRPQQPGWGLAGSASETAGSGFRGLRLRLQP